MDADFATRVREWTTRPEFLSPLVDHLPVADGIPSPKDVLGHHAGAPRELTYHAELLEYYRALAAASPRVSIMSTGRTDENREMVVVAIAAQDTIRDLERYRGHLSQLADPRDLSELEAAQVIAQAKPIYHFIAGLHSGETGPPEMLLELAYRLAVEEGPLFDQIRKTLIVTLTPVAEPDGRDRYVDWYYRHLVDITDDRDRIGGPPYWGKYVFHDNNRDINYSQLSMRSLLDWYLDWHPPIMHDLHESVPFLYTFSGQAPQNPGLDPIVYGELPWFANFEMAQLTKYGMPGAWTHGFVDMWSPGYLGFMASNHNGLERAVEALGLTAAALTSRPDVPTHEVDLPRLAIFSTWGHTQEVGWVRHAFDQFEIPFDLIFKERVSEGDLWSDYDVILIPNQGRTGKGLVFDVDPRAAPLAYTKTDQYRFLGDYGSAEDITGGIGIEGVLEFQRFVDAGGVLVTLGSASYFPPDFGLTRAINARRPGSGFYAPGPIVEAEILKPTHPIFYGYEKPKISVRYANGPLLQGPRRYRDDWVLMRFPGEVMSGLMRDASQTEDEAAIVDVPRGDGRVVLFATNP